jgi:hypothetical protein
MKFRLWFIAFCFSISPQLRAMGLRSLVALPVNKGGSVLRFLSDFNIDSDRTVLFSSFAYGLSGTQAILFGLPYGLSTANDERLGDFSALYRRTLWQKDTAVGTNRLAFLGGFVLATGSNRDDAAQAGLVFSHFKDRHEIDINALFQRGFAHRPDSGRYDFSWQYRINPTVLPDWGIADEIYTVVELNGRWQQGHGTSQQFTAGLSWVKPRWVIDAGIVQELNKQQDMHLLISSRFHF